MLMNTRKFCDSYIVSDKYEYQKMKESNRIKFVGKIYDDLLFVSMEKKKHTLSNPIAIGVSILGISKWILLSHWYRMKDLLGDDIRNASVDTDSFHNVVYNEDLSEMIAKSLIERRCMIAMYGKSSPQVLDRWFLCEDFDLSTFQINIFVRIIHKRSGLRN